jgi:hypothetical protein
MNRRSGLFGPGQGENTATARDAALPRVLCRPQMAFAFRLPARVDGGREANAAMEPDASGAAVQALLGVWLAGRTLSGGHGCGAPRFRLSPQLSQGMRRCAGLPASW